MRCLNLPSRLVLVAKFGFYLLRHFHEVEPASGNVLDDPAEVGLLAGLGLAGVDAVVVLARLVGRALLVALTLTLRMAENEIIVEQGSKQQLGGGGGGLRSTEE